MTDTKQDEREREIRERIEGGYPILAEDAKQLLTRLDEARIQSDEFEQRLELVRRERDEFAKRVAELEGALHKLLEASPVKACVGGVCDHATCQFKWAAEIEAESLLSKEQK